MTATVLFISPDYASHYYPMSALGAELGKRRHHVVFASGPTLEGRIRTDGFDHSTLILGRGNNSGVIRLDQQTDSERVQLEAFFRATQRGMVPALRHQAEARSDDLLHEPGRVAQDIEGLLERQAPDMIVVDHLAFGATAALRGLGRDFIAFHPGHPSAIAVNGPYGFPAKLPMRVRADQLQLEELRQLCVETGARFTAEYNEAIRNIDPVADQVDDAFASVSPTGTIVNYPNALGAGYGLPPNVRFIGSSVRKSQLNPEMSAKFAEPTSRPRIYVSLGSFLSVRADILRKIVKAFRREPVELVISLGVTDRSELGEIPRHWTVADQLPQPAILASSSLVITHGGNNTVTEALTSGVPPLVGPLSTDQFAAAADIEESGLGLAFDPNFDDAETITDLANEVLAKSSGPAAALGESLRSHPGQRLGADIVESVLAGASVTTTSSRA